MRSSLLPFLTSSIRRQLRQTCRVWAVCAMMAVNMVGAVVLSDQIGQTGDTAAYACQGSAVLMTNISPDIHC